MRYARIKRNDTPVMFVAAEADPTAVSGAAQRAFSELESRLDTLRGRRFFGVFDPASSEYLACVQTHAGDDAHALSLRQMVIPGGAYLRATITGQPPELYAQIGPTFEELEKQEHPDSNRPFIEFYRRHNEIDLLVPVPVDRLPRWANDAASVAPPPESAPPRRRARPAAISR
jgi:hypothetical protein